MRNLGRSSQHSAGGVSRLGRFIYKTGVQAVVAERRIKRLAKTVWALKTLGGGMASLGLSGVMGGYPLLRGVKQYADYEDSLISIRKVWTGKQKDYDKLVLSLKDLNAKIPLPREAIAGLMEEGIRAKVSKTDSPAEYVEFTKLAAKFMVAFNLSASQAPQILAKLKSQLGMTMGQFEEFGDTLNTVANSFSTNEKEMLEGSKRIGGLALSIGGMKAVKGSIAILGAQMAAGTPKEVAATGLRTMIARLSTQPSTTRKGLKMLGLDPKQVKKNLPADLYGTIYGILLKISKLKPENRAGTLSLLAGMKSFDAFSRLMSRADLLAQVNEVVQGKFRLTMASEFERRIKGLNSLLQITKNMMADTADSIVVQWRPEIAKGLAAIQRWAKSLDGSKELAWAAGVMAVFSAVSVIIVPLGIFLWSLKAIGPMLLLLLSPLRLIVPLLSGLAAILAFLLTPVGLVVAGLAALGFWVAKKYDIGLDDVISALDDLTWAVQHPLDALEKLASFSFGKLRDGIRGLFPESWLKPMEGSSVNPKSDLPESYAKPFTFKSFFDTWRQSTLDFENSKGGISGKQLAKSEADKQVALAVKTETTVKVDVPGSIILKLPNGIVAGSIPITTSSDKGRTQVDSAAIASP